MSERLPIYEIEHELIALLGAQSRLILSAPTGSGKSTQVPQMLLDRGLLGEGEVVVLQPRRLATRMLANRVAQERRCPLGQEVGYQIRLENVTSAATRIRFVTEGVLLRQMLHDPRLRRVSALVFDEFHERHLYGDITLAQALALQESTRPDLRLVVMSATLDASTLRRYLRHPATGDECACLESTGRTFPVEVRYARTPSYVDDRPVWTQAVETFEDFVQAGGEGDVLVFMPGAYEINQTIQALRQSPAARGWVLLPLHGELPPRDQDAAVARYQQRKIVVATNVAETSLTIDGVRCVIDSGLARQARYDACRGLNTLLIEKISRAAADQRTGRAGRTAPGLCLRLWSSEEQAHRPAQESPEVKRLDLSEVVLTLKAAGIADLRRFRWLEPPEESALAHAETLLLDLGALHAESPAASNAPPAALSRITETGRRMLAFPLHPRHARMLLAAEEYGCVREACLVAAITQGRDLLLRQVDSTIASHREQVLGEDHVSDFLVLIRAWKHAAAQDFRLEACRRAGIHQATARQVGPLWERFLEIAQREGLDISERTVPDASLQKCLLIGFSDRVARRLDEASLRCELVHGRRGTLARESVVQRAPLLVCAELREIGGRDGEVSTVLSLATAIEEAWLRELFPDDLQPSMQAHYDPQQKRVVALATHRFRGLALSAKRVEPPPADDAARLLADEVTAGRLALEGWDESVERWIERLAFLAQSCPELGLAPITVEDRRAIIEQLCLGAVGYKDIRDKPVRPVVESWLSPSQRGLLDKHAPERLKLPNGRTPKVNYEHGRTPYVALRIQELFDVSQTPRIALGRVPVVMQILTPGHKPVQVTQDLANFWREHYPKLKSTLQRRYPKHEWR